MVANPIIGWLITSVIVTGGLSIYFGYHYFKEGR